jgi:transcriptional regulator with XRE-family HTH domain
MKIGSHMSEAGMAAELGNRAQHHRVSMNLTQAELARSAGVSQRTVERFEAGNSVQLDKLLRILRALRLSDNLDQLVPETSVRPIQLAASKTEVRQRSYKRRNVTSKGGSWIWGDTK